MTAFAERYRTHALAGITLLLVAGAFVVSDGLYNIDEFIYLAAVEAMRARGSLVIENGFEEFGAESLKLWFLVKGPNGLAPQYPVGSTLAGVPFAILFGTRGLIILNALAAAATLFVTHSLARSLCGDKRAAFLSVLVLVAGTYWLEYAYGLWPHALSVFFVTTALFCAVRALREGAGVVGWGTLSGLAVGAGFLFRTDSILILPAIGATLILFAERPWRGIAGGILGLLPAAGIASFANELKFGSFNPLSYGPRDGGGVAPSSHLGSLAIACLIFMFLLAVRHVRWRREFNDPALVAGIAFVGLVCTVPVMRELALQYFTGAYALVVDAKTINDPLPEIFRNADGVLFIAGAPKKALGQSLPWLGLLLMLVMQPWHAENRRAVIIVLVALVFWTLPFFMRSWHGGFGSNMRYFLPLLPLLSILATKLWIDLTNVTGGESRLVVPGAIAGVGLLAGWILLGPSHFAGAQQIMPTYLLFAVALASLLAGWHGRGRIAIAHAAQFVVAAGFIVSTMFAIKDFEASQFNRAGIARASDALSHIPSPSLIVGYPEIFTFQIGRPGRLIAAPDRLTGKIDIRLLQDALASGYRTFVHGRFVKAVLQEAPNLVPGTVRYEYPGGNVIELVLR